MKRIVILVCGMLFLVSSAAEARTPRTSGGTYTQQVRVAPASYSSRSTQSTRVAPVSYSTRPAQQVRVAPVSYSTRPTQSVRVNTSSTSTRTAQGVANIMARTGRVGHFGGNTGYEGCGSGGSPSAAFNNCCYANSGMTTVDVGYARGAGGNWFCCRRYR